MSAPSRSLRQMRDSFPAGGLDMADLPKYFAELDRRYAEVKALPPSDSVQLLTARRFDEAQPAGHRVWIAAERQIGVAMECHRALMALLEHHGATPTAPWTLLRPAFEAGFYACWVLDPDNSLRRRQRGLRCEVYDHRESNAYLREFEVVVEVSDAVRQTLKQRAETENVYKSEAHALRMKWEPKYAKPNVREELGKLAFLHRAEPLVRATMLAHWRMLSGYEHGLTWALMIGSDRVAKSKIPGGQEVAISMNDSAFVTAYKATMWLIFEALSRYRRLHTSTVG